MSTRDSEDDGFRSATVEFLDSLCGAAVRLTRNADRAQDLVQDTYLKAIRARRSFAEGRRDQPRALHETHVETCEACRQLAHAQSVARTVLKARAAQLAPPGLRIRIVANTRDLEASHLRLKYPGARGVLCQE